MYNKKTLLDSNNATRFPFEVSSHHSVVQHTLEHVGLPLVRVPVSLRVLSTLPVPDIWFPELHSSVCLLAPVAFRLTPSPFI